MNKAYNGRHFIEKTRCRQLYMLSQAIKKDIQQAYSQFLNSRELKPRYGQKHMIAHIANCLSAIEHDAEDKRINDAGICAVEAGTGTGKTVAYTLSVLPIAKALGKKVVISTATVALQEQIIYRDLPDIARFSGLSFRYGLAKGRGRYLCLSKLDNLLNQGSQESFFEQESQEDDVVKIYDSMAKALLKNEWDGDKDNWQGDLDAEQWQTLTSDRNQCAGRRCQHVTNCSFIRARDDLASVDCIVANHDLVMADLALGGGAILSEPEETIYIFDEAHHLSDIALRHFADSLRLHSALQWVDSSIKAVADIGKTYGVFIQLLNRLDVVPEKFLALKELYGQLKPMAEKLCEPAMEKLGEAFQLPYQRFENGVIPEELTQLSQVCSKVLSELMLELESAHTTVAQALESNDSGLNAAQLEVLYGQLGQMLSTAERHWSLFKAYVKPLSDMPDSRWIQLIESGGLIDFEISSSPLMANQTLRGFLWQRCYGAVLTSATLTALGEFDRLRLQTGLPDFAQCHIVHSPFDYFNKAQFVVPAMHSEANQALEHTAEIVRLFPQLIKQDKAALLLFSSKKQLQEVYESLDSTLQEDILCQSDMSKQRLLNEHQSRIDNGERSILFGLASLAEGVDLPGKYCEHVIIAKLPFAVPNGPLDVALSEWFESQGKNPFMELSLPEASQKLIQACGRLIRTENDTGRISLLDKRILTKRYGARLLASLPPFKQVLGEPV